MTNFTCPYCGTPGDVDLTLESERPFGVCVCSGCVGFVMRIDGEWITMDHEMTGTLARECPGMLTALEAQRISIVRGWLDNDKPPPTILGWVMVQMVLTRGWDVCRYKQAQGDTNADDRGGLVQK